MPTGRRARERLEVDASGQLPRPGSPTVAGSRRLQQTPRARCCGGTVAWSRGLDTSGTGYRDGLAARHVTFSGTTANVGPQHVIAHDVSTQLPAAAVNDAGHLAVLFDEYRNPSQAHSIDVVAAVSADGGSTFNYSTVSTFTLTGSHPVPEGRPLGDYQQLRAVGPTFYGAFAAARNGFDQASPLADRIDAAFIKFSG
jgi:hypothetical protein